MTKNHYERIKYQTSQRCYNKADGTINEFCCIKMFDVTMMDESELKDLCRQNDMQRGSVLESALREDYVYSEH